MFVLDVSFYSLNSVLLSYSEKFDGVAYFSIDMVFSIDIFYAIYLYKIYSIFIKIYLYIFIIDIFLHRYGLLGEGEKNKKTSAISIFFYHNAKILIWGISNMYV